MNYRTIVVPNDEYRKTQRDVDLSDSPLLNRLTALKLSGRGMRVLLALLAELDYNNFIEINQTKLASLVGITRPDFAKELKKLLRLDLIIKGNKSGVYCSYKLHPSLAFDLKVRNYEGVLKQKNNLGFFGRLFSFSFLRRLFKKSH